MKTSALTRILVSAFLIAGCTTGEARNQSQPAPSPQSQKELFLTEAAAWKEEINWLKHQMSRREADLAKAKAGQDRLQAALQATEAESARLATALAERNSTVAKANAEHNLALAKSKADRLRLEAAEAESARLATALVERNSEMPQRELQAAKEEVARLASVLAEREATLTKVKAEQDKARAEQGRLQAMLQADEKEKALLANTLAEREATLTKVKAEQDKARAEQGRLQAALQAAEKEKALLANASAEHEAILSKAKADQAHLQATQVLQAEITKGNVRVQQTSQQSGNILLIEISEPLLFGSALDDRVSVAGIEVLKQIADVLKAMPERRILIEGHTGHVRIKDKSKVQFSNAVELSKARTLAVFGYLKDFGVDHQKLSASWHLETRPLTLVSKGKDIGDRNHYHFDIIASPIDRSELPVAPGNGAR